VQPSPPRAVDARADRAAQAIVGVILLAAFVFRLPWLVPVLAVVLAPGALLGPRANPFVITFDRLVSPRLSPAEQKIDGTIVQAQDVFTVALAVVASLGLLVIKPFGWLLVIATAISAVVAASTGVHAGAIALRRFTR
jgi:hypothetical protein